MRNDFTTLLSFGAIILSIIAIVLSQPYCQTGWDGLTILIAILTVLVTVLITWQIYTLVDLKNVSQEMRLKYDNMENRLKDFENAKNDILATLNDGLADVYDGMFNFSDIKEFKLLHHRLKSILYCSMIGDIRLCNHHINEFLVASKGLGNVKLNNDQKYRLNEDVKGVVHPEDFPDFIKVVDYIKTL